MRQYGGVSTRAAIGILILFCLYLAIYHGVFGLLVSLLAGRSPFNRRALLLAPVVWVAVELARTRITGFPWDLLGIDAGRQHSSGPHGHGHRRLRTVIRDHGGERGVRCGLSGPARKAQASLACALSSRRLFCKPDVWFALPALPADHTARLVQANVPILQGPDWTKEYFDDTLRDLTEISLDSMVLPASRFDRLAGIAGALLHQ